MQEGHIWYHECYTASIQEEVGQTLEAVVSDYESILSLCAECSDRRFSTVVFHIDGLMMSHKSPSIVTGMIKRLDREYGKRNALMVTQGLIHKYLGIYSRF